MLTHQFMGCCIRDIGKWTISPSHGLAFCHIHGGSDRDGEQGQDLGGGRGWIGTGSPGEQWLLLCIMAPWGQTVRGLNVVHRRDSNFAIWLHERKSKIFDNWKLSEISTCETINNIIWVTGCTTEIATLSLWTWLYFFYLTLGNEKWIVW